MNIVSIPITPRPARLTTTLLNSARELAVWHRDEGRLGTSATIFVLVAEIEALRESAKGQLVVVNQACATASLAELKASVLLMIAEKLAPVIDCETEDWDALQGLSGELNAAIRLAKG